MATTKTTTTKTTAKTTKAAPAAKKAPAKAPKKEEEIVKVDLLDVLLDENNTAPIYMYDSKGNQLQFEQVAVIPYGEDDLYCILKPITKIPGVKDDEAIVFLVDEDENGEAILKVEGREEIAISVFDQYYNLVEEEAKKNSKKKKASDNK
jgi:hypothetical protein